VELEPQVHYQYFIEDLNASHRWDRIASALLNLENRHFGFQRGGASERSTYND